MTKQNQKRPTAYTWAIQEIEFYARKTYENPYTEVILWIDLKGPNFSKRIYGFWDGGQIFKIKFTATGPGEWSWQSGSNQPGDNGLNGKTGGFLAKDWPEQQKQENPNKRGIIRATQNGRALEYADGTPFFLINDTLYAGSSWRIPFKGIVPDPQYQPGPGISFEELIAYRKRMNYNSISMISCFPNWSADHMSSHYWDKNDVCVRASWEKWGKWASEGDKLTTKDMHDEKGNRPFVMSREHENVADFNRVNPAYFQSLDKKIHYLWEQGFIVFLEPVRRDTCPSWNAYFDFPNTYPRFVQYIISRYGSYNLIFSGIHLDIIPKRASLTAKEYNAALIKHLQDFGPPPYDQPFTTLINESTYRTFGHGEDCPWLTMHSVGNKPRNHLMGEIIEELFGLDPPYPIANFEPYYPGWKVNRPAGERPPAGSDRDNYFTRAQMYGCVLSGALGGHTYGHGGYDCTTTGEAAGNRPYIWEALRYKSGEQMQYLKNFILSEGNVYRDLVPVTSDISPQKNPQCPEDGLDGWSYMLRSKEKDLALLYFENKSLLPAIQNMLSDTEYELTWYDPGQGIWLMPVKLTSTKDGHLELNHFPGEVSISPIDWALKIKKI